MCQDSTLNASNTTERRTLVAVLAVNLAQAAIVGAVGALADSAALLGAALDNLADGGVYAISLYAVGRTVVAKSRIAHLSGTLLFILALLLLAEVIRRFFVGADPVGMAMIAAAAGNVVANLWCLKLLRGQRENGVHMKASWIFTTNDMLANVGIIISGIAVMLLNSAWPDLIIGLVVVAIAFKGGWEIFEQAREARRTVGTAS